MSIDNFQALAQATACVYDDPSEALSLARDVVIRARGASLRAEAHFTVGVALMVLARHSEAVEAFTQSASAATTSRTLRIRTRSLNALSVANNHLGREEDAARDLSAALDCARALGDIELEGVVRMNLGVLAEEFNALAAAEQAYRQALHFLPEGRSRTQCATNLGLRLAHKGSADEARRWLSYAADQARTLRLASTELMTEAAAEWLCARPGNLPRARRQLERLHERAASEQHPSVAVYIGSLLGEVLVWQQDWAAAQALGIDLRICLDRLGWKGPQCELLEWLRAAHQGAGDWASYVEVCAVLQARLTTCLDAVSSPHFAHMLTLVQPREDIAELTELPAIQVHGRRAPTPVTQMRLHQLSDAEREAVRGVVQGLSNAQIAAQLGKSAYTVRNQLAVACAKLGVHTRAQLAVSCAAALG
ncbi:helix-turn-helix domain-containing protein [Burkholderia vietnamiensis]|uniref:helix-turn-helix domain-containing protein n=1 Tax=Burkholderia vietnamiensis TaxID=60552 RepID=UPI001D15ABA5|nr:helix-turn-helix transcriptional regulator [Burkholderia vietnamiensis]UEC01667.1 helix-turn-helix transcriptional regulator [Burkholderia vietnamiensis]